MNAAWEYTINTGNPDVDRQTLDAYRQSCATSGMHLEVQQLPTGGYHVRMSQPGAQAKPQAQQAPQQYGAPQQGPYGQPAQQYGQPAAQQYGQYAQPQGTGQPYAHAQANYQQQQAPAAPPSGQAWQAQQQMAFAGAGAAVGGGAVAGEAVKVPALSQERIKYLRKVYGLLTGAVGIAALTAMLTMSTLFGTEPYTATEHKGVIVQVPSIVSAFFQNEGLLFGAFALLFVMTFVASWTSKVPVLNVIMLFLVSALMGLQAAPMVFYAQTMGGLGDTLSTAPVRDAFLMTFGVFAGITGYVYITRKDFSWMGGILSMGTMIVFIACILGVGFGSEPVTLAICSVGALISAGWLLYMTSYIFRKSKMDNAVGDALVFLVQLRNLFMFLLRILMSRR